MTALAVGGPLTRFPIDYGDVLRFAVTATLAMVRDGRRLIEIEFPPAGLETTLGEGEAGFERSRSAEFIAQFVRRLPGDLRAICVLFPDKAEAETHRSLFNGQSRVRIDFLTHHPTSDTGIDLFKRLPNPLRDEDELVVVVHPFWNTNEVLQIRDICDHGPRRRPLVVVNGQLEHLRNGFYPPFFYPRLAAAMKGFLPRFDQAFFLHNYDVAGGGAVYRVYPEPFQVFRRHGGRLQRVHQQDTLPRSTEVANEILPHPSDESGEPLAPGR
eukprot:EG_transcript_16159